MRSLHVLTRQLREKQSGGAKVISLDQKENKTSVVIADMA